MKYILQKKKTIQGAGEGLTLTYSLFRSTGEFGVEEYGIAIEGKGSAGRCIVPGLTTSLPLAEGYFHRLVRNDVTPLSLMDLTEDFLAEI